MKNRALALLITTAFLAGPFSVFAQEVPLPDSDSIATDTPSGNGIGEILATSTVALPEAPSESLPAMSEAEDMSSAPQIDPDTYVPGQVVVKFEDDDTATVVATTSDIEDAIVDYESNPEVEYAEPNFVRSVDALTTSTDTYADQLWGLENTGQEVGQSPHITIGTNDADIDASEAWASSTGQNVIVAVIDTGVDYTHTDLAANMWDGSNCVDANNAPIPGGCLHGYDFADHDNNPMPVATSSSYQHGTHVAGTIAAVMNNQVGVIGVAPNAKIMALRFGLDTTSEAEAIRFAIANGATIINASYAGVGFSQVEHDAIADFQAAGGLFIAAAANSAEDMDTHPQYPASQEVANVISVTATNQDDALASFSNYGLTSVDLAAPGTNILSTYPGNAYAYASGTSMAAPHVTGAAALIKAFRPALSAGAIKDLLLTSGDALPTLSGKSVSGKRVNAFSALEAADALTADRTAPIITLLGDNPLTLTVGDTFTDPGATASDDRDGDITASITIGGVVDTSVAATYTRTYVVSDAAGNTATSTRDVIVDAPASAPPSSSGGGGRGGGGSSHHKSGGGGGGSSKTTVPEPGQSRLPQDGMVLGASTGLTPEQTAQLITLLLAQLALLQAELAALLAQH